MKLLLLSSLLFMSSCRFMGWFRPEPKLPGLPGGTPPPPGDTASIIEHIAYWGSGLASIAILCGIILLWQAPKKGQQLIAMAVSVLIGCQLMLWIAAHLFWIGLVTAVVGLGYIAYRHRDQIEDLLDGKDEQLPGNPEG